MEILITEIITGHIISVQVILGGLNYNPSEQAYFDEAWRCAIDDNLVVQGHRGCYAFSFSD